MNRSISTQLPAGCFFSLNIKTIAASFLQTTSCFVWLSDTTANGTVDGSDDWLYFAYDDRWRIAATFWEGADPDEPYEQFTYHNAGLDGQGGSSYIDAVVLRDRDENVSEDGVLEERVYICQNWRADVSALLTDAGIVIGWAKFSAYGVPHGLPGGDTDSDGDYDGTDATAITGGGGYDVRKDVNLDGSADIFDATDAANIHGGTITLGRNVMTSAAMAIRKGYAGYELDPSLWGTADKGRTFWHVRHRVLDSGLGRWVQRDPAGYVDGKGLYAYGASWPVVEVDPFGRDATFPIGVQPGVIKPRKAEPPADKVTLRCKDIVFPARHCWIVCCTPDGRCSSYSLWPSRGDACMCKNLEPCDRDSTGTSVPCDGPTQPEDCNRIKGTGPDPIIIAPGIGPIVDPNEHLGSNVVRDNNLGGGTDYDKPGQRWGEKSIPNACACLEAAFWANATGCRVPYSLTNCNSNWYANSLLECCSGRRWSLPFGAGFGNDRDCCRNDVRFSCPNGSLGSGRKFICERFANQ